MFTATDLPACTTEDGSAPGQTFPCYWDAHTVGNGQGMSFVMPSADTYLYADGTLLCPANTEANDTFTDCVPLTVQVGTVDPIGLAHTGMDPHGAIAAAIIVTIGVGMVAASRLLNH
jgi:hypothetical protein